MHGSSEQCLHRGCQGGDAAGAVAQSCPKSSPFHVGKQTRHVKAHPVGLFALQLLDPCLSQAEHLDIITLCVLVLF